MLKIAMEVGFVELVEEWRVMAWRQFAVLLVKADSYGKCRICCLSSPKAQGPIDIISEYILPDTFPLEGIRYYLIKYYVLQCF